MNDENVNYIDGIRFPDGECTTFVRKRVRLATAKMVSSVSLEGMRVLDIGCNKGYWDLYFSRSASQVIGVDYQASALKTARNTAGRLGVTNVEFLYGDIRDAKFIQSLGTFDIVVAFGFLHRIVDPFSFVDLIGQLSPRLWLEWRTPIIPMMEQLSFAYHSPSLFIDRSNLDGSAGSTQVDISTYGDYGFWDMTPRAVRTICNRVGYRQHKILGYTEYSGEKTYGSFLANLKAWSSYSKKITKRILQKKSSQDLIPRWRVQALFSKDDVLYPNCMDPNQIGPPEWDVEMQKVWHHL